MFFEPDANDDPGFVRLAEGAIRGWAALTSVALVHVVKVDAWFGPRWYGFAGKAVGALGLHNWADLKVPPFHPHRVVGERRFRTADPPVRVPYGDDFLHHYRPSESNLRNRITRLGESIALGWYGGDAARSGRGAVMGYASTPHGPLGWYAGLARAGDAWRVVKLAGADGRQWAAMLERGGVGEAAGAPGGADR